MVRRAARPWQRVRRGRLRQVPGRSTRAARAAGRDDEGQVLLLTLLYALVAFALVAVVTDVTSVHLQRNRLTALADAAALDAADGLDAGYLYQDGLPGSDAATGGRAGGDRSVPGTAPAGLPLSDATVRASVLSHLADAGAEATFTDLAVGATTGSPDGRTAQVTLVAVARLPILTTVTSRWWSGVPLRVTSRARARPDTAPAGERTVR